MWNKEQSLHERGVNRVLSCEARIPVKAVGWLDREEFSFWLSLILVINLND